MWLLCRFQYGYNSLPCSPNSDEALSLLSMRQPPTKETIEEACSRLLELGVGAGGRGHVIIRSGALGAYVASRAHPGRWVDAYWSTADAHKVVDVTGGVCTEVSPNLRSLPCILTRCGEQLPRRPIRRTSFE